MPTKELTQKEYIQEASVLMRLLCDKIINVKEYDNIMKRLSEFYKGKQANVLQNIKQK